MLQIVMEARYTSLGNVDSETHDTDDSLTFLILFTAEFRMKKAYIYKTL
jgi:hypothetical protein